MNNQAVTDARTLGTPKMMILGFQHLFAMFGATVLVPLLTGLDVATTLLMAGLGTLLFHLITGGKVPAFLGSSFAFLGGYGAITDFAGKEGYEAFNAQQLLPYACLGVACAGLLYFVLAGLVRLVGIQKIMRFFPPVVTGPIIIAIGLGLAGSAVSNCNKNWLIAFLALAIIIVFNVWGKGMLKIIPILLGVLGSCAIAAIAALIWGESISVVASETTREIILEDGTVATVIDQTFKDVIALFGNPALQMFDVAALNDFNNAAWIGLPIAWDRTVFGGIDWSNGSLIISSIIAIMPIALATMMEHIGDICAISSTCGKSFIKDPGLHRTLIGDGAATTLASLFGAPANTTYGENTGVLALSKVYDPRVVRIAAIIASVLAFCPKFAALIHLIPTAVIGGISFVLYGMISAVGVRNVVENKVDFSKSRNLLVAAIILVCALGLTAGVTFTVFGVKITLSAIAIASIAGILLNAILPEKDEVNFEE